MAALAAIAPAAQHHKLRVALFADSRLQPRWIVEAFDKVARSDFADIVIICAGESQAREPLAWKLYGRFDRWAFGADPSELVDLAALNPERATLLSAVEPEQLSKHLIDVAFVLGELDERVFEGVARYGVWRFCFGTDRAHAESLAGWRELAEGTPVTATGIKIRLSGATPTRLAYESWSRIHPLSLARTRARLLYKTSEFAWRALRELHRSGQGFIDGCRVVRSDEGAAPTRTNADLLRALPGIGSRMIERGVQKALSVDQWFLAWRFGERRFGDGIPPDLQGYTRALPPRDREWADPFPIERNGRYFLFFEEMPFAAGKGHISMMEIKRDGSRSAPVRVLERDYHLSYPFLIEEGGELYMIPESGRDESVQLFRCVDFPLRWKLEKTLLKGVRLVDATFHRAPDRWWMFANAAAPGSREFDDELHLFHAQDLLGPWYPHRRNPVKSDARCARPAGHFFTRGAALYRPAQICVPLYGAGISLNRVQRLTTEAYAERQVERILPTHGILGLHTVNHAGDLTVIDAFTRRGRLT